MKVSELHFHKPVWIDLSETVRVAEERMVAHRTNGLLVRDATGRAVGVFSRADLSACYRSGCEQASPRPQDERIERWVSPHIVSVSEDVPVQRAIREMLKHGVHRIFVTSKEDGTFKGVITMIDMLKKVLRSGWGRRKTVCALLAFAWMGLSLAGAEAVPGASVWTLDPKSTLSLEGDSTLHKYHSKASQMSAVFETSTATVSGLAELIQTGQVTRMEFTVAVDGMQSGKSQLDRNMSKALRAKEFPEIQFRMTSYALKPSSTPDQKQRIEVPGRLKVAGQEREIVLMATVESDQDHAVIEGKQDLLMSDYGIKPPVMMLGTLKTADKIVIHYSIVIVKNHQ